MSQVCVITVQRPQRRLFRRSASVTATLCIKSRSSSKPYNSEPTTPEVQQPSDKPKLKKKKKLKWRSLLPEEIGMSWDINSACAAALQRYDNDPIEDRPLQLSYQPHSHCSSFYNDLDSLMSAADDFESRMEACHSRVGRHMRAKKKWAKSKVRLAIKDIHARDFNIGAASGLYIKTRIYSRLRERIEMAKEATRSAHMPQQNRKTTHVPTSDSVTPRAAPKKPQASEPVMAPHQLIPVNVPTDMDSAMARLLITLQHRDITPEDYDLLLRLDETVAPKTVDNNSVAALKTVPAAGDRVGALCSVCLQEIVAGALLKFLPCDHAFHVDCIDRWLKFSSQNCPLDGLPVNV